MCDTNIHKALQIIHITSVKCDAKVKGWGGGVMGVTMTLREFGDSPNNRQQNF